MKLNDQQRELVSNNIKLIHKVIHDKVHNPHQAGIFSYDDLFQIGCIGLCKAAATDKGGVFSTYAYRLIWNEICSALEYASVRSTRESLMDPGTMVQPVAVAADPDISHLDLEAVLDQAEQQATGVVCFKRLIHHDMSKSLKTYKATKQKGDPHEQTENNRPV